ncbi:MAG: GtrA family protein [Verrucomicrobia bacterium]|nr:GtrA family protein [Verrucomicrobiota bacterium]
MKASLKRELLRFLFVGGIAVLIDGSTYFLFTWFEWLSPSWAKRISFALGAIWAFVMNKYYTFEQKTFRKREPPLFVLVYAAGWFFNSVTHDLVLHLFSIKLFAFLVATGVSTCTNFVGQKWIVFRLGKVES